MSNFTVFQSSISALLANNQALSVAANNIANVNTEGYSRQRIVMTAENPQVVGGLELGRGVTVATVERVFDAFVDLRLASAAQDAGKHSVMSQQLKQIDTIFNELGVNGIGSFMDEFFNAWQEVSNDPSSTTARQDLLNKSNTMTEQFNSVASLLEQERDLIDAAVETTVTKINDYATEIANLNERIKNDTGQSLTLRDERMQKVRELSGLVDTVYFETSQGEFNVTIAQGMPLVTNVTASTLSVQADVSNDNHYEINLIVGNGAATDITDRVNGGELQGLLDIRDTSLPSYQDRLNELAYELATEVNALHSSGYTLNGTTSVNFFTDVTTAAASTTLLTDLRNTAGTHLDVSSGNTITVAGSVGGTAFSANWAVSSTSTLGDIVTFIQNTLRGVADADLTETAVLQADGSIRVTSDATHAITNLTATIAGNTTFNTAFTWPVNIAAGGGTGDSTDLRGEIGNAAASIALHASVDGVPRNIAAASSSGSLPGGNAVALTIAALRTGSISFLSGDTTFSAFYGDLVGLVGSDTATNVNQSKFSDDVFTQARNQRDNVSGVSVEEEQLNLIRYQSAFEAASKLISVADRILEQLVNIV